MQVGSSFLPSAFSSLLVPGFSFLITPSLGSLCPATPPAFAYILRCWNWSPYDDYLQFPVHILRSVHYRALYPPETGGSRHRGSNFNNEEYKQMQVELQDMKNQVNELQEMRNKELEEIRKQMEEMKSQLAIVFNNRNGN